MQNNNKNLLIIGGFGFIGSYLVDKLTKDYPEYNITVVDPNYYGMIKFDKSVHCLKNKIQDLPKTFFTEFNIIILLGGQGSASNNKNLLNVIDNNIRNFSYIISNITCNQKFIYASSSSVYGKTDNKEVDENYDSFIPYNYYDWSKESIDQLTKIELDKNKDLQIYGLRFGTVNGFSRNFRNDVMINSMVYNSIKNGKIFVTNHQINRPILGINDLYNAVMLIIKKGNSNNSGIYNLNSFNSTVGEIGDTVSKIVNVPIKTKTQDDKNCNSYPVINFKLSSTAYDFKINSNKFIKEFDFTFNDTLSSITQDILDNFNKIEHFENRLVDRFDEYTIIEYCRVCETKTESLLDLNFQPLANNYTKFSKKLDYNPLHVNVEIEYPLHLHYCPNCFHVQLNCVVSPDILFKDYIYVSGTSKTLRDYFDRFALNSILKWSEYAEVTESDIEKIKNVHVLDIGCNDCSQLDAYTKLSKSSGINITTVGVDPSINIYKNISSKKTEHDIYCGFFKPETVNKLNKKYVNFDIIVAQNVFPHTNNLNEFLTCAKQLLSETGTLLIQTSQKDMILENDFDSCYAEHLSFFNTNSMKILCEKNNLFLNNVEEDAIHGTSYIFEITKTLSKKSNVVLTLFNEMESGLYDKSTYINYKLKCLKYKNDLHNKLIGLKLLGKNIIGFGSTAKVQVCLNFVKINNDIINYIIDENKLKQNLFTPGSNILITNITSLKTIEPNTVILITAWNFYNEILEKIKMKLKEYNIVFPVEVCNIKTLKTILINN